MASWQNAEKYNQIKSTQASFRGKNMYVIACDEPLIMTIERMGIWLANQTVACACMCDDPLSTVRVA
jgi:hypothetical protein